jgi:hypothetical protein
MSKPRPSATTIIQWAGPPDSPSIEELNEITRKRWAGRDEIPPTVDSSLTSSSHNDSGMPEPLNTIIRLVQEGKMDEVDELMISLAVVIARDEERGLGI